MSYHINPKTNRPNQCGAQPGKCPFGAHYPHYPTKEAAQKAIDESIRKNFSTLSKKRKTKKHAKVVYYDKNHLPHK